MDLAAKTQYKYTLKLSSDAGKIGEMIMQNVFNSGFIIENNRSEDSILFFGYEPITDSDKPTAWKELNKEINLKRAEILNADGYVLKCEEVRSVDWVEKWKKHFAEIKVGDNWIIIPSWQADEQEFLRKKKNNDITRIPLIIKPGVAFGSGHHPSTKLVLQNLAKIKNSFTTLDSVLDIGSGTGIVAIGAAKLNFSRITAVDIDKLSVENTRENLQLNGLVDKVEVIQADFKDMSPQKHEKYDLIVVNCLPQIIKDISYRLPEFLTESGFLILSGFMNSHRDEMTDKIISLSSEFEIYEEISLESWVSLIVKRKAGDKL